MRPPFTSTKFQVKLSLTRRLSHSQPNRNKRERERKKSTAKCSLNRNKCTLRNREPSVIVCYLSLNICTQIKYDKSSRDRFSWYPFAGIRPLKPHYVFPRKVFLLIRGTSYFKKQLFRKRVKLTFNRKLGCAACARENARTG